MKGQTLVELLIAVGIFVIVISSFGLFILDSFVSTRLAKEMATANLLAEEGIEVTKSIKDNSWDDILVGNHGLVISGNNWVFEGSSEDISSLLKNGTRVIAVEEIEPPNADRKKITSIITWEFTPNRTQEIKLATYLTNWQKLSAGIEIRKPTNHTDILIKTTNPGSAYDYPDGTTWASTLYDGKGDSITFHTWEQTTKTYNSLSLKYRYHADQGIDDTYAVAYSTTGCAGAFTDLISPTSSGASDTTISVVLSPSQDLSQLCLKIYTNKIKGPDNANIYTRDIWTEGDF